MKIGQFAVQNETSIDAVRHYMSLGLIIPEKHNKQFEFDDNCTYDFKEITTLKKIGFTLSEIQQMMLYRRIGKLTGYDRRITYTSFFEKKKAQIESEIVKLDEMKLNLDAALIEMNHELELDKSIIPETLGIPFKSMDLFCCPECHGTLNILDGKIQNDQLINAILECDLHHKVVISDGVIYHQNSGPGTNFDEDEVNLHQYSESYIDEYINTTHIDYLQKLYSGLEWSSRHLDFESMSDEIVLELGSGHGYFMRHMIDRFPKNVTYIAVDHDAIKIRWLKKIIERSKPKCNVVFICSDFTKIPLKPISVDWLLDISGSSNFAFDHQEFLLDKIDGLTKEEAHLHGYYIIFKNFASASKIPLEFRDGFKIQPIKKLIKNLGYKCIHEFETEPVEKGGPLEDYFVEGEHVCSFLYTGIKVKKPLG